MAELAWPTDLGHGTFIGRFGFMDADTHDPDRDPDITSATGGTVTITPSVKSVRYTGASGPMILAARPAKGVIDAEGYLCTMAADGTVGDRGMVFPATNDTDLSPTDWTYSVSIVLDGSIRLPSFDVKLLEGSTVDLSVAVPVPPSGGTAFVVDTSTADRAEAAAIRAETAAEGAETGVDLTGYATEVYVDNAIAGIAIPEPADLTGLASETWVNGQIAAIPAPDLTGYAEMADLPDVTGLASETYVDTAISAIPAPDLSSYATKAEVPDVSGLVSGDGVTSIVALTQAQYDALTPDVATLYVIREE